jgi:hypothetical protein
MTSKIPYALLAVAASFAVPLAILLTLPPQSYGQAPPLQTVVEQSPALPPPPSRTLGTMNYKPTQKEAAFFSKLKADEQTNGSMLASYSINGKKGMYVGWCGIVRKIDEDSAIGRTKLLVEHKYFDGLTDTHIMALSFNGAGDFACLLSGAGLGIKSLSLIRAYGAVVSEDNSIPVVQADYVREWDWGRFTFLMSYGTQKGNKAWNKLNKVKEDKIYDPFPDRKYYEDRLGPRTE